MRQLRALPQAASGLAAMRAQPRAFTRAELVALLGASAARTAVARCEVTRLLPNAYVAAEHAESFAARADAALTWAGPGAALASHAACFAWTLVERPPPTIALAVPPQRRLKPPPWLALKRVPWSSRSRSTGDVQAVEPAIAIATGYADLTESERVDAIFGGIARGIVTATELRQVLVDLPRIRGRRALTSRIEAAERGAESWLEELGLRQVFTGPDYDQFIRQHEVRCRGRVYRLDMFDPFTRTAVELDSVAWHSGDRRRQADIQRDAELATLGILTVRLSTKDLTDSPDWCRDIVREVVASRREVAAGIAPRR